MATRISGTIQKQIFVYCDSKLKICVRPGLEAQKVEKHCPSVSSIICMSLNDVIFPLEHYLILVSF